MTFFETSDTLVSDPAKTFLNGSRVLPVTSARQLARHGWGRGSVRKKKEKIREGQRARGHH